MMTFAVFLNLLFKNNLFEMILNDDEYFKKFVDAVYLIITKNVCYSLNHIY